MLVVQPLTVGQVDEVEQENVAKTLPSLPCIHPSVALQWWLLQAPCCGAGGALYCSQYYRG